MLTLAALRATACVPTAAGWCEPIRLGAPVEHIRALAGPITDHHAWCPGHPSNKAVGPAGATGPMGPSGPPGQVQYVDGGVVALGATWGVLLRLHGDPLQR